MYTAIVYDLDGTLIDSAIVVTDLLNELREERGLTPLHRDDYIPWLSIGGSAMVAAALETNVEEAEASLTLFRARYVARPTDPHTIFPGVHETLTQLKNKHIRLGLCTNKPRMLTEKVLRETGLMEHFDVICAGNDLPTSKPHPDNMKVCIDGLQSAVSETLIVGDSRVDQRLAELSGVDFAFFSRGYDDGVNLTSKTPVIHHHHEVLNLI